jgi:hypothetical protein
MDRIHIAASQTPLESGIEHRALCGALIPNCRWVWTIAGLRYRLAVKDLFAGCDICAPCLLAKWDGLYVYAMVAG